MDYASISPSERSHSEGRSRHNAYLEDYAFLIAGLLDLYDAVEDRAWAADLIARLYARDGDHRFAHGGQPGMARVS